ncbi:MAG TPA: phosphoglycerate mutase family protein [Acidimicrobiales bacterium]|nr:phosphoglycerate mutase family protein [Acidimicrobiales bacterium]
MADAAPARPGARVAYLVRHADAVARGSWPNRDGDRPLSDLGRRQADALAEVLAPLDGPALARALSSSALRCRETLVPAARRAGVDLEQLDELAEGSDPLVALDAVVRTAMSLAQGASVVACSHGDVIDGLLETLEPAGVEVVGPLRAPKASVWELEVDAGALRRARYVAPPVPADV